MGGWVEKKKESEGEGAGLYGLRSTTKEKSGAPKLYSAEEVNGSRLKDGLLCRGQQLTTSPRKYSDNIFEQVKI